MKVGVRIAQRSIMMAAVAAAASVPSSLTTTKALWTTFDSTRSFAGDMPVKEERDLKKIYSNTQAHLTQQESRISI